MEDAKRSGEINADARRDAQPERELNQLAGQLIRTSQEHLREGVRRIGRSLEEIDDRQLWADPEGSLVSIGNLILHLQGNVGQYIVQGIGKRKYQRERSKEFTAKPELTREKLLAEISQTIDQACDVIGEMTAEDLIAPLTIQGFEHTGTSALIHVVEHFSYHVGQISYGVKYGRQIDLGYYAGLNLEQK